MAEMIAGVVRGRVRVDVPMSALTTLRVGGPADVLVEPMGLDDVLRLAEILNKVGTEAEVMGRGSNLLVSDRGIRGVVIRLGKGLSRIRFEGKDIVEVEAGCNLNRLIRESVSRGLGGIERLIGIPGSLGGAVRMNAGAFGQEVGDTLEEAWVVSGLAGGEVRVYGKSRERLNPRYRGCDLEEGEIIVKLRFRFRLSGREELEEGMREALALRRERQPLGWASAGSVFKNPPGMSAGELIERCGLKGKRVGDAMVSEKHANFIINRGKATASDVRSLVELIKEEVYHREGVVLEEEVRLVGDWGDVA